MNLKPALTMLNCDWLTAAAGSNDWRLSSLVHYLLLFTGITLVLISHYQKNITGDQIMKNSRDFFWSVLVLNTGISDFEV